MTRTELETLHRALLEIKTEGPLFRSNGICYNLHKLGAPTYEDLDDIFRAWPKCDTREKTAEECAYPIDDYENKEPWKNPLRHELLDFMIEYCRRSLTNETEDL